MTDQITLFAFDEADHLTRIHLKLALEDAGFAVCEDGDTVAIVPEPDTSPIHRTGPIRRTGLRRHA